MVSVKEVEAALKNCNDPELDLSVIDMGLIYDIKIDKNNVFIKMTLTSPMCPVGDLIQNNVRQEVEKLDGVENVDIELVWDPPWGPENLTEEAKAVLGV